MQQMAACAVGMALDDRNTPGYGKPPNKFLQTIILAGKAALTDRKAADL